ncbi:hypothetical protein LCGC14_2845870, partial [marine sediment metagenome]
MQKSSSNRKPWTCRVEPLERRELLSVAPGGFDDGKDGDGGAVSIS